MGSRMLLWQGAAGRGGELQASTGSFSTHLLRLHPLLHDVDGAEGHTCDCLHSSRIGGSVGRQQDAQRRS